MNTSPRDVLRSTHNTKEEGGQCFELHGCECGKTCAFTLLRFTSMTVSRYIFIFK